MKLLLGKIVLVLFSLLPAACHYHVSGPLLWKHTSSSAFDLWLGLWIFSVLTIVAGLVVAFERPRRDRHES
jgi:hypothetical protein